MKKVIYVLFVLFVLSSCRTHSEPRRLIITPSEHHFGVEGGTVVLTLKAEDGLRYDMFELGFAAGTTNRNGVVMDRHLNPSAPDWEEFEVEFYYSPPPSSRSHRIRLMTEWFELKRNEALNQITVAVDPNTSGNVRKVVVVVYSHITHLGGTLVPITQAAE